MSQIIVLQPHSEAAGWLFSLKVNKAQNRMSSCVNKIGQLYKLSQSADIGAMLTLFEWYRNIRKLEGILEKESNRLNGLIQRKIKDKVTFTRNEHIRCRLRVADPVQFAFYRVLKQYDIVTRLAEACRSLLIFKSRLYARKRAFYRSEILKIVTLISNYKYTDVRLADLNSDMRELLYLAIHSNVMPTLPDPIIRVIETQIKKSSSITTDQKGQTA